MRDQDLNRLLDSFVQSIVTTLEEAALESYAPTALIVDCEGNLRFDILAIDCTHSKSNIDDVALEFGKQLAREQRSVAAIFVAEQISDEVEGTSILVSAATPEGLLRSATLGTRRLEDGMLCAV